MSVAHDATTTLCAAVAAGIFLISLAERLQIPSIVLLLVAGIVLGPEVLGLVRPDSLGGGLETVVTLAVAVVLFEGGLTLETAGFRREPVVILRMLTIGVAVTWFGAALAVYLLFDAGLELAAVAGSLVIVTGPTVVSPILRRIRVQPRLHHVLYWEGVLVDAVGVFIAVFCFEWIVAQGESAAAASIGRFALRFIVGAGIGVLTGGALAFVLRAGWIATHLVNAVVLGAALLTFALANTLLSEAGILAVISCGLVLKLSDVPELKALKRFKLELTDLSIGLLFVLLAARLDLSLFVQAGTPVLAFLAVVVFLLRPINIAASTWGQGFSWRERAFLSWLAPRGIVAASMASLFALKLESRGFQGAYLLETLTYAVIGTTVIAQGMSAPIAARLLGLRRSAKTTWVLVGDARLAVELHRCLRQMGVRSLVVATEAEQSFLGGEDIDSVTSNSLGPESLSHRGVAEVEGVIAVAPDTETNDHICEQWAGLVGGGSCYRWDDPDADVAGPGVSVWRSSLGPSRVRAGIEAAQLAFETVEVGGRANARRFGASIAPLLVGDDGKVSVVQSERSVDSAAVAVVLRQRVPGLYGLIRDAVVIDRHDATFANVIAELMKRAAQDIDGLDVEAAAAEVVARETDMPTVLDNGIAVPHLYLDGIDRSHCYVANVVGGIGEHGPDGMDIVLVFLVISAQKDAAGHLRSLAAIAGLAATEGLAEVAAAQRTRGRLLSILREHE